MKKSSVFISIFLWIILLNSCGIYFIDSEEIEKEIESSYKKDENNIVRKEYEEKTEIVPLSVTDFVIQDCLYDVDEDGVMEIVRLRAKLNKENIGGDDTEWQENTWLGWKWYKEEIYLDIVDYQEEIVISSPINHRVEDGYFDDGYRVKGMEIIHMSGIDLLCIFFENMGNRTMPQIRLLYYQKEISEWVDYFEAYSAALEYKVLLQDNYIAQVVVEEKVLGELELSCLPESELFLSMYYKEDGTVKQEEKIQESWYMNGSGFSGLEILHGENGEDKILGKKKVYIGGKGIGWIKGEYQMENGKIVCEYSIEEW